MGLVYNSHIDQKERTDFSGRNEEESHYHLHVAKFHQGMTGSKSRGVCEMTGHNTAKIVEQGLAESEAVKVSFEEFTRSVLSDHCSSSKQLKSLM